MDYTTHYSELRDLLRAGSGQLPLENEDNIQLLNSNFKSEFSIQLNSDPSHSLDAIFADSQKTVSRNAEFNLPIVRPAGDKALKNAIILLHGLNERSWEKYMPWAYSLAQQTGKSVILFPIAYHMDRSPESWNNPREMSPYVSRRTHRIPGLHDSSYVNIALSERIDKQPQRFFLSGYQAAQDIMNLMDELKEGRHPLFEEGTHVDFFAYSIGVLLSEVLLMANPGGRFGNSRFFFFCGGSVLEGMRGGSRFIIDTEAFSRLASFYNKELEDESRKSGLFSDLLSNTRLGQSFIHLTSFSKLNRVSKKFMHTIQGQIQTICLKSDKVMPAENVRKSLSGTQVIELDFPYQHTHEVPFPLRPTKFDQLIDKAFTQVFSRAGLFLAT
ncbi:MAG: hypothetical protein JW801_12320 [Bacteroidales bacterium]|nr:hypothetical protein [Bacteroidales bacterium]